jgi:hypothetical protein
MKEREGEGKISGGYLRVGHILLGGRRGDGFEGFFDDRKVERY